MTNNIMKVHQYVSNKIIFIYLNDLIANFTFTHSLCGNMIYVTKKINNNTFSYGYISKYDNPEFFNILVNYIRLCNE